METHLKIKHIAPYLPYKIPARLSRQGIFNLDLEYPDENVHKIGFIDNFYFNDGDFSGSLKITEKKSFDFEDGDIEFVLRPLSDLTKEIEINGEKFVPLEFLGKSYEPSGCFDEEDKVFGWDVATGGDDFQDYYFVVEGNFGFSIHCGSPNECGSYVTQVESLPYDLIQKLFEWHFDVFGLIEEGLAIDINTLK